MCSSSFDTWRNSARTGAPVTEVRGNGVASKATHEAVAGNLLKLLASYNSGPNGFAKWCGGIRTFSAT